MRSSATCGMCTKRLDNIFSTGYTCVRVHATADLGLAGEADSKSLVTMSVDPLSESFFGSVMRLLDSGATFNFMSVGL